MRGQAYDIQVQGSFQDNANGFVEVWINGVQVVDYHGPIGYGAGNYWKEGVYEGGAPTQTITVDYANTTVAATPNAPIIASESSTATASCWTGPRRPTAPFRYTTARRCSAPTSRRQRRLELQHRGAGDRRA